MRRPAVHYILIRHPKVSSESVRDLLSSRCCGLLSEIRRRMPQSGAVDGERNAWIVKPATASRGKGVILCSNYG